MMKFSCSFQPKVDCQYDVDKGYGFAMSPEPSRYEDLRDSWPGDYFFQPVPTLLIDVPNGNYQVHLTLGASDQPATTTVKEGLGHLKIRHVETKAGEFVKKSFAVHVSDGQLKLAFSGLNPSVRYVEVEKTPNIPTIYLAGDSTVTDQSSGQYPYTGWGQMFSLFLNENITVANHARSGRSSKSFIRESRLNRIAKKLRANDFLFIQFAHNDEKDNAGGTQPFTTYQDYLKKYVDLARSTNAHPVLVAPMHRRFFDKNGHILNTHGEYIDGMRQLAEKENVPFVDLAQLSKVYFEKLGEERSKKVFLWAEPGQYENLPEGAEDNTHFSEQGAIEIAKLVAKGIHQANISQLSNDLLSESEIEKIVSTI